MLESIFLCSLKLSFAVLVKLAFGSFCYCNSKAFGWWVSTILTESLTSTLSFFLDEWPVESAGLKPGDRRRTVHPENIVIGNLSSEKTLVQAGIREAKTLLLTCSDDALNLAVLTQAKVLNSEYPHC